MMLKSLKSKILGFAVSMSLLSFGIGLAGFWGLHRVKLEFAKVTDSSLVNIVLISKMDSSFLQVDKFVDSATLWKDKTTLMNEYEKLSKEYLKDDKAYQDVPFVEGEELKYKPVAEAWSKYNDIVRSSLESFLKTQDQITLTSAIDKEIHTAAESYGSALKELLKFNQENSKVFTAAAHSESEQSRTLMLFLSGFGLLGSLSIGYILAAHLSKRLDEFSKNLTASSEQMAAGGAQLSSASSQLSSGATEAAASLEETVASLEELSSMVKMNTDSAQQANALSKSSREAAEHGAQEIEKLIGSMNEIASGSKKIEEIIHVIDDIAFQTNLLALNAAVEAARAGEQGKGFAVVAEAVRTLAQKSADAARDINNLIKDNVVKSEQGAQIAAESEAVLNNILVAVKKVSDLNGEIAAGSQEQATGLEQISKAMNQLDQATQGNAASSEEVAASSEQMSQQAVALSQMVSELRGLIHGVSAPQFSKPVVHEKGPEKKQSTPVVGKKAQAPHLKLAKTAASQAIPFDEDDGGGRRVGDVSGF